MTPSSFKKAFLDVVTTHALSSGYRVVGRGQSLAYDSGEVTAVLIRLGGRMSRAGAIAHILCGRHRFLRSLAPLSVPTEDTLEVNDYPYKFRPSVVSRMAPTEWRYEPSNLGHWSYDLLEYRAEPDDVVYGNLRALQAFLAGPVIEWAKALTPERAVAELRNRGENAWCERVWIEDYVHRAEERAGGAA